MGQNREEKGSRIVPYQDKNCPRRYSGVSRRWAIYVSGTSAGENTPYEYPTLRNQRISDSPDFIRFLKSDLYNIIVHVLEKNATLDPGPPNFSNPLFFKY